MSFDETIRQKLKEAIETAVPGCLVRKFDFDTNDQEAFEEAIGSETTIHACSIFFAGFVTDENARPRTAVDVAYMVRYFLEFEATEANETAFATNVRKIAQALNDNDFGLRGKVSHKGISFPKIEKQPFSRIFVRTATGVIKFQARNFF